MFDSSNKSKTLAIAIAVCLHGLAAVGLANMQIKQMAPLKITPPLEVKFVEPEKIVLNDLESPEPPKPLPKQVQKDPVAKPKPVEGAKATEVQPKPKPKAEAVPKVEPKAEPKPQVKPEPKVEPKIEPKPVNKEPDQQKILEQQRQAAAAWEAQQRAEQAEKDAKAKAEREAKERANREARERAEQAERDAKAKAARDAAAAAAAAEAAQKAAAAKQGSGTGKKGSGNANQGTGDDSGGPVNLGTLNASSASWSKKPNFSGVHSDTVSSIKVNAQLAFDKNGKITEVKGIKTGDSALDRQLRAAILKAKLNPNVLNGNSKGGSATFVIQITVQ